jgi:hypothetical protein
MSRSAAPTERSPFGRLGGHAVTSDDVSEEKAPPSRRPDYESYSSLLVMGLLSAAAAALLTSVVSFFDRGFQEIPLDGLLEESVAHATLHPSDTNHEARSQFLAGLLSEEAFIRKSQVHFIAQLITSHLKDHPEPEKLANLIVSESVLADYDPFLVAAVIRSESMFKRGAVSYAGARGLMQIMPATASFLAKRENIAISPHGLYDPRTNVRLGIAYLKHLEKLFRGNRTRALIAYNWGPANLGSAIKRSAPPPSSTIKYAQKILAHHALWRQRYMKMASNAAATIG